MAIKIAIGSQKGGIGKTTTTAIFGKILAASGFKVLAIDLDTQGNLTKTITRKNIYSFTDHTIMEAMQENNARKYIVPGDVDLIPAEDGLAAFPRYIYRNNLSKPAHLLQQTIAPIEADYDFILMDLPPQLSDIVANAIIAADYVIVPVHLDGYNLDAIDRFLHFIDGNAEIMGILFLMREKTKLQNTVAAEIREKYGNAVFSTEIRKRAGIGEISLSGITMAAKSKLRALEDYIKLTQEVLKRVQ